jgi:hypothetical protein
LFFTTFCITATGKHPDLEKQDANQIVKATNKIMERAQINMHDHLPEFSALLTVLAYIFLKNTAHILTAISTGVLAQINLTSLAEATFLAGWAAFIGWCIRYIMDNHGKNLFKKFKKPKIK